MDLVIQYAGDGAVMGWSRAVLGEGVMFFRVYWPKSNGWPIASGGERTGETTSVFLDEAGHDETKWNHLARIEPLWGLIKRCRYVCFADDDVQRVGGSWREAFDLMARTGADAGQCALTRDSYYSHPVTLFDPESDFRRTNFVEMMAPILASECALEWREAFRDVGPVAWGVEALWSGGPCAILDKTPMRHHRPVRALEHAARFGRDPVEDRAAFMARWRLTLPPSFSTLAQVRL